MSAWTPAAHADSTLGFSFGANCILAAGSGATCSTSQGGEAERYATVDWTGLTSAGLAQYLAGVWMAELWATENVAGSPLPMNGIVSAMAWDFSLGQLQQMQFNSTLIEDVDTTGETTPWRII